MVLLNTMQCFGVGVEPSTIGKYSALKNGMENEKKRDREIVCVMCDVCV